MKIPKNPIKEIQYLYPNTFFDKSHDINRDGTITQKKLPIALQTNSMDKLVGIIYTKYLFSFLTIYILISILTFLINHVLGFILLAILIGNIISHKTIIQIYKTKKLIQKGINEYNNNYDFTAAINAFQAAQMEYPPLADELNDWIVECYNRQNKYNDALEFIQTHNVTSKRIKTFILYALAGRDNEALNYFEKNYTKEEIKKHPAILMLPVELLAGKLNQPDKAIEYLEVKHNYIFKQFMNKELSYIKEWLALCYQLIGNYQKAKEIYQNILEYNPYNYSAKQSYEDIILNKKNNLNS